VGRRGFNDFLTIPTDERDDGARQFQAQPNRHTEVWLQRRSNHRLPGACKRDTERLGLLPYSSCDAHMMGKPAEGGFLQRF